MRMHMPMNALPELMDDSMDEVKIVQHWIFEDDTNINNDILIDVFFT